MPSMERRAVIFTHLALLTFARWIVIQRHREATGEKWSINSSEAQKAARELIDTYLNR